jgi:hypothetical protein
LSRFGALTVATGAAIKTYEWGQTITAAFEKAGLWAIGAIAVLLWLALRRVGDVLLGHMSGDDSLPGSIGRLPDRARECRR